MQTIETFTLDTEVDRDILLFLSQQPNRSRVIRDSVRLYMRNEGLSLRDILDAIESLRAQPTPTPQVPDQPEEAVANLLKAARIARQRADSKS